MSEKFLEVKDLSVIYTSNRKIVSAVNGVSFSMKKGETLGLVGETGAGKTTIAKAILRILPDPPSKIVGGSIAVDGTDVLKLSEEEMKKIRGGKLSMIFQDPMTALNPLISVGEQITEGLMLHNSYTAAQARAEAERMLEMVGIPRGRYVEYPFEFSGGMKQRVVIAMALACNPELLLADEPTTALDVTIQAQVLELIGKLQKELHTSMILITHDLGVVAQTCDNVATVYAGEIIEYGTKRDIFLNPMHPYTVGLFNSLPSMVEDTARLQPIPGSMPDPTNLPSGCSFHPRCPYAAERCRREKAPDVEVTEGHFCRCWRYAKED